MIALYRPGHSLLHRLPAAPKLIVLVLIILTISITGRSWQPLLLAWLLTISGFLLAGLGLGELGRQIVQLRWLIAFMLVVQLIFLGFDTAMINVGRVTVVIVLASLVTLTTRMEELLAVLERALAPLRHVGVPTAHLSLVLALTITTIPVLTRLAGQIREVQLARTGRIRTSAFVLPMLVLSLKHADELADALRARGVE